MDNKKVDKVDGKGLSANDFTDLLYAKLDGIEEHANYITKVSELLNDSDFQNAEQVEEAIQKIIGSAPEVLDTLAEIAKALGDDPNFAATMTAKLTELENKLTAEKNLREQGDDNLQQSFTNLSTTLTTTVNDLRTFVSETRTELLTSLNATNALVNQNSANIQRNSDSWARILAILVMRQGIMRYTAHMAAVMNSTLMRPHTIDSGFTSLV